VGRGDRQRRSALQRRGAFRAATTATEDDGDLESLARERPVGRQAQCLERKTVDDAVGYHHQRVDPEAGSTATTGARSCW
jgi:hypothetical protein